MLGNAYLQERCKLGREQGKMFPGLFNSDYPSCKRQFLGNPGINLHGETSSALQRLRQ